ncbi:DUF1801 domain-containing protein [Actinokineospora auranticolor]|uniref:Uncharacterized protein DUF1801 n=1 Tax=Actinokineospora auranticolor TaxID=155976 RepID=A0A2S6GUP7_9PSEU|nr:DUF1801 domain-containing protein [Actinokineospora auranticolor]PPK68917.1 uncharacterized protein DUF1801 [Actinokineospora auranticolor]
MEPTTDDVAEFVAAVPDPQRRADAELLVAMMAEVTGEPAVLWGTSIIGFGSRHYRYDSGREGDTPAVAFAPRKPHTVLYLTGPLTDYPLTTLGKHTTSKGCVYLKHVNQTDQDVLRALITQSFDAASEQP